MPTLHRFSILSFEVAIATASLVFAAPAIAGLAEATDNTWDWTSGSSYNAVASNPNYWISQAATSLDGVDAAEGRLEDFAAERSWMETTVTGPTTLYFSYNAVDFTGSYGGTFTVLVNDTLRTTLVTFPGSTTPQNIQNTGWREATLSLGAGTSTVRWQLDWFRGVTDGRAYVDQVWTSNDPRPRITGTQGAGTFNTPFAWTVPVASSTPATLTASDLPPGLALNSTTHAVTGTPTLPGAFASTFTAENASGKHVAKVVFDIAPGMTSLPEGLDAPSQVFAQRGGGPPWTGATGLGHADGDCVWTAAVSSTSPLAGFNESIDRLLSTTVDGPGTLNFWCFIEGQAYDYSVIGCFIGPVSSGAQPTLRVGELNKWTQVSLEIPAGPQTVSWIARREISVDYGIPQRYAYLDAFSFQSRAAEIEVTQDPSQTDVANGGVQYFGSMLLGTKTSRAFTIHNKGEGNLTGLTTLIDGPDAADFSVVNAPVAPVAGPQGTTSFTVQFSPTRQGARTATLHIENNDPDENPFTITLTGTGSLITAQPASRVATPGQAVTFSVGAHASASSYQWRKDGVEIPGAVGPTFSIPSAQPWHIGDYTVTVTGDAGTDTSLPAALRLTDVPEGIWRGIVSYYAFDGHGGDALRPGSPADLVNATAFAIDPERGPVLSITGKGFAVPPFPWESPDTHGPGGYVRIPRPIEARGESFTVSLLVKEQGYSHSHGEAFVTLGEAETSTGLLGRYWVGGSPGLTDHYGPDGSQIVEAVPPSSAVVAPDGSAVISNPSWNLWTLVASGDTLQYYRQGAYLGSVPYPRATTGDIFIGRHWWLDGVLRYSTRFIGAIDDVRIFNRALTATEVAQLHAATSPQPSSDPYVQWAAAQGLPANSNSLQADPEGDGLTNWEEYAFGTHPLSPTPASLEFDAGSSATVMTWLGRRDALYDPESSYDLRTWGPAGFPITPAANQGGVPNDYQRLQMVLPLLDPTDKIQLYMARIQALPKPSLPNEGSLNLQPPDGEPPPGSQVTLALAAASPGLTYQWFKDGQALPQATEPSLVLSSVQTAQSGRYHLSVTNAAGTVLSRASYVRVTAAGPPVVATKTAAATSPSQASAQGLVIEDGGTSVTERGIVYSHLPNPTLESGIRLPAGNGVGIFNCHLSGLQPSSTYHLRSYAVNAAGVTYGDDFAFATPAL